ncbi:MAG: helix-turn-helix domain-containing protein [Nannocystaceae bacterium]
MRYRVQSTHLDRPPRSAIVPKVWPSPQKKSEDQTQKLAQNTKKWGQTLMDAGWTCVPSVILERQHALGLDSVDVNILLQLASYWWYSDNPPYPSIKEIAERISVHRSTVQRHLRRLKDFGFIEITERFDPAKKKGQLTNQYTFKGLIQETLPFAEEKIAEREERRRESREKGRRKRPKLVAKTGGRSE